MTMLDKVIKSATNHNLGSEVVDTSVQEDEWIDEEIFEGYFLTTEELIQQEREIIEDEWWCFIMTTNQGSFQSKLVSFCK
jgi:hypothetical protein